MRKVLGKEFFNRDTTLVAQELLGKFLVRKFRGREIYAMITETEAYDGPHDKASHASKGETQRTKVMFGHPGYFYVYLVYGMHQMLNIVTREHGYPAAVLIRGVKSESRNVNGPGKVTKFFTIGRNVNNTIASKSNSLWFEERLLEKAKFKIKNLPRIGVDYAGPMWANKKLRFVLEMPKNAKK